MKVVIQRVSESSVTVNNKIKAAIASGLLILAGFEESDSIKDVEWMSGKICRLRVFNDAAGVMNHSVTENKGDILVVSQFTLHAGTKKGNRPSYIRSARPEIAIPLYENFISCLEKESGRKVLSGTFGANMKVQLINDGPVTIIIDSKNRE